ncbi:MAG: hypothetical protein H0W72_09420 [Planctomycetes bacterium]|nr:hypothetical protein [Planctomycetota bacterium]
MRHDLPSLAAGFVRISVRLRPGAESTPGSIARATGLAPEDLGPIAITGGEATVDVRSEHGRQARNGLGQLGPTMLMERRWQWLRIAIGRNHGLTMGQLRKILQTADALPLGRISIQNTHTLVGLTEVKMVSVVERLAPLRINGYPARPTALPPGTGPGSAMFIPRDRPH